MHILIVIFFALMFVYGGIKTMSVVVDVTPVRTHYFRIAIMMIGILGFMWSLVYLVSK